MVLPMTQRSGLTLGSGFLVVPVAGVELPVVGGGGRLVPLY
jgi:hypothetical protein